jgi:molybdate/tungstate transport system substrate-binding protein
MMFGRGLNIMMIRRNGLVKRPLQMMILLALILSGCSPNPEKSGDHKERNRLVIFHAGSMSVPLKAIIAGYEAENPDVTILTEAAGSREAARKISELKKPCDILISADYRVINDLLVPEYAAWSIGFASNEMVIAFNNRSEYGQEISSHNWHDVLMRDGIRLGRSEPESDPCGYRTVITLRLADMHYGLAGLSDQLLDRSARYIRPKETDLLALLETGHLDYIFIYRSVAGQHKLPYVLLPDEINLKNAAMAPVYREAVVGLRGKTPGDTITVRGEPMVYGLTIPHGAENPGLAEKFLAFFLHPDKGMRMLEELGQPPLSPMIFTNEAEIPVSLKRFLFP